MKSPITTHVLDTARGTPAADVAVSLEREEAGRWMSLASKRTDRDGRVGDLLAPGTLASGLYRITFGVGAYFQAQRLDSFYPEASVTFRVTDATQHFHVPLLVSPFGFTTYRGS